VQEITAGISSALASVKALSNVVSTLSNAELKMALFDRIADLQSQIINARTEMLEMQDRYEQLLKEHQNLKETTERKNAEKPTGRKWGCYTFAGDDGLYCTACWETKAQKSSTNRVDTHFRSCPVCRATIGA
jgi:hypothetical protein